MLNFFKHRPLRGQTALEYLLLLAVVAIAVVAGFNHGGLVDQIQGTAGGYYNTVTEVIMGKNPVAKRGGWCPATCPPSGTTGTATLYATCECPPPTFGGQFCQPGTVNGVKISSTGQETCTGVTPCGPCPTGQVCNAQGQCGCPNGLTCEGTDGSPGNSIPNNTCSGCICEDGWFFDQNQDACVQACTEPCTYYDDSTHSCQPVDCNSKFANSYCDTTQTDTSKECQCYDNYQVLGGQCVPVTCTANVSGSTTTCTVPKQNLDGTYSCVSINCVARFGLSYCNAATDSCDCDDKSYWNGSQCVKGSCTPNPTCPGATTGNATGNVSACGRDSCGTYCGSQIDPGTGLNNGTCGAGESCDFSAGSAGTCQPKCNPQTQIWNQNLNNGQGGCAPLNPCVNVPNSCGFDSNGNACGNDGGQCPLGEPCTSSASGATKPGPGICCLSCQTLENGACVNNVACGNNSCGFDSCGNPCGTNKGSCPAGQTCSSTSSPGNCS